MSEVSSFSLLDRGVLGQYGRMARPRQTVRVRIMVAVLITTILGMVVAGLVSYLFARQTASAGIRDTLTQANQELVTLAAAAERGEADRPIRTPADMLHVAISRAVANNNEAILGVVDGQVKLVPGNRSAFQDSITADQDLLAAATAVLPGAPVIVTEITTATHARLAFVSVPVQVAGSAQLGHYVSVVDVATIMARINREYLIYAAICLAAAAIVGIVSYQVAGRLLAPLHALQRTAQRISEEDLSERISANQLASNDEVSELGRSMNAMLDRISESFDYQRRMLDDAGHELRTPLTIVRGHLELVDPNDPADVKATRDLVISELDRMQDLVSELMLLAKARRPDFVTRHPVVLAQFLEDVLAKVQPLGERDWRIEGEPQPGVRVLLDAQRVTQALVELTANAIRHTEPGAVIALGASHTADRVQIWVRDAGIGIAKADQEAIFERFRQLDSEVPQDPETGGFGLGLAIVEAIARAHQGGVRLESTPGVGSRFTLDLPVGQTAGVDLADKAARETAVDQGGLAELVPQSEQQPTKPNQAEEKR